MKKKTVGNELTKKITTVFSDMKATDIAVLDLRDREAIADYFVLCSGTSTRHVDSIADEVVHVLKQQGEKAIHVEGGRTGTWVLIDYGDVIVHVFYHEARTFYNLDKLWTDLSHIEEIDAE